MPLLRHFSLHIIIFDDIITPFDATLTLIISPCLLLMML